MVAQRLVQFTDTHLYGSTAETLRGVDTAATLQAVLRSAAADIAAADALLVTGDIVQDDLAGYEPFRRAFAGLGKPVHCLPGNHDLPPAMARSLRGEPFHYCGDFALGDWRIVMLDSTLTDSAGGHLDSDELSRLEAVLQSAAQPHLLICLHHHPVPMRSRWLDTVGLDNASEFFSVLDRHNRVRAVLWGHVHQELDVTRGHVRLLATPSTCSQFKPRAENFAIDTRPPAYRRLTLNADGSIDTKVIWVRS